MSRRIDPSWTVMASPENGEHNRCVDIFRRGDGSWGFEEFRRDPEDAGGWTAVAYHAHRRFASQEEAERAAERIVVWLGAARSS